MHLYRLRFKNVKTFQGPDCSKGFSIITKRIVYASRPKYIPDNYILKWANGIDPSEYTACVDRVLVYYSPPRADRACCDGWKVSETKFPSRDKDTGPFILRICTSFPFKSYQRKGSIHYILLVKSLDFVIKGGKDILDLLSTFFGFIF